MNLQCSSPKLIKYTLPLVVFAGQTSLHTERYTVMTLVARYKSMLIDSTMIELMMIGFFFIALFLVIDLAFFLFDFVAAEVFLGLGESNMLSEDRVVFT